MYYSELYLCKVYTAYATSKRCALICHLSPFLYGFSVLYFQYHLDISCHHKGMENEEGEHNGHGEGDEAKLEGVDLHLLGGENFITD